MFGQKLTNKNESATVFFLQILGTKQGLTEFLPSDGTTNFAHGYPSFSVSIGVLFRGKPAASTVVRV